jgi:aminoglycoside phosphotransferase family enzyme/predicted kinase
MATLPPLIAALHEPRRYDHPVERVTLVETHISWVLLTGRYAYKVKKPLDLGFLDFSTLEKRHRFCEEELRLNRRLAPEIYLAVVPIAGTPENPQLGGAGAPIEYAVKMREFPQEAQLDRVLARGELKPGHIDDLAARLAEFHQHAAVAGPDSPFGTPERVWHPVNENFEQIRVRIGTAERPPLERLAQWSRTAFEQLKDAFAARKRAGFVRECHGDAHLANMVLLDDRVMPFDCLEFNDNLRWIDVLNEVAFAVMDLESACGASLPRGPRLDPIGEDRGQPAYARRLLNAYLEHTGDYDGLKLLRFYQVYRALVRAKVAAIRLRQPGLSDAERERTEGDYRGYIELAERYTRPTRPVLMIAHGLSGTGKTTLTQPLVERLGAVRVRSDVERKRLYGLAPTARSGAALNEGLYTAEAGVRTYDRLAELAHAIVGAGYTVIIDATFLRRAQRDRARALAEESRVPFLILAFEASEPTLRERVVLREQAGVDASEAGLAVLAQQLASAEPLGDDERAQALVVNTDRLPTEVELSECVLHRLASAGAVL